MKLCIPISQPAGLDSMIHPHLPDAEHLLFIDLTTREYEHLALRDPNAGAGRSLEMDAVLCGSINRMVLRQLIEQGIAVYGVDTQTVAQAIARFENGELEAVALAGACAGHGAEHAHGAGGCCSGGGGGHGAGGSQPGACGGHGHRQPGGCACGSHGDDDQRGAGGGHQHAHQGGGCGGHGDAHEGGGCCGSRAQRPLAAVRRKSPGAPLRVAVCSQNRKTVTEHAGQCRKFWIYDVSAGQVTGKTLLELPLAQSLHASPPGEPHPLDGIDVLIAGGAGDGLTQRLAQQGVECVVTRETDLELALAAYLGGLPAGAA